MNINDILLTEKSKYNFLLGLIRVSKADGIIEDTELAYFQSFAYQIGISEEFAGELDKWWKSEERPAICFENRVEALFFIREAIQLCCVDDMYADSEKDEIRAICSEIGIEAEAMEKIEKWVMEGMEWNKRGEGLLLL